jgi:hypothetical protein
MNNSKKRKSFMSGPPSLPPEEREYFIMTQADGKRRVKFPQDFYKGVKGDVFVYDKQNFARTPHDLEAANTMLQVKYGNKGTRKKKKKKRKKKKKGGTSKKAKKRWSRKYKKSINCRKPKGFSQKQYCKYGRK